MQLIAITVGEAGVLITALAVVGGWVAWWATKLLVNTKDVTILQQEMKDAKEDIREIQDDVKQLQRKR